jgi:hypothetical protein
MPDVTHASSPGKNRAFAPDNVKRCLATQGVFRVAPLLESGRNVHFCLRHSSHRELLEHFPRYAHSEPLPLWKGFIHNLRKG